MRGSVRSWRVAGLALAVGLAFAAAIPATAVEEIGVGFRRVAVEDPVTGRPMDVGAFHPSPQPTRGQSFGPYDVAATLGAPIAPGRHAIVVISHGDGGGPFSHHDLATALARRGDVVIVVSHPGGDHRDQSGLGGTGLIFGRPAQVSAALDAVAKDEALADHVDPTRIGFLGFSAGGTTGLLLAGARPDFARAEAACASRPRVPGPCEAGGRIRDDRPGLAARPDPRIGAFALLAPASVIFPAEEIRRIMRPVAIWLGGRDTVLPPEENGLSTARALPERVRVRVEPAAGHFTFLAPCSARMAASLPALCRDDEGVDRAAFHARIAAEIGDFFADALSPRSLP